VVHAHGHGPNGFDVNVATTSSTVYQNDDGTPGNPSEVAQGAEVQVKGTLDTGTNTLTASRVLFKHPEGDGGDVGDAEFDGTVASVSTSGFVLHPKAHHGIQPPDFSVAVTGTTVIRNK